MFGLHAILFIGTVETRIQNKALYRYHYLEAPGEMPGGRNARQGWISKIALTIVYVHHLSFTPFRFIGMIDYLAAAIL